MERSVDAVGLSGVRTLFRKQFRHKYRHSSIKINPGRALLGREILHPRHGIHTSNIGSTIGVPVPVLGHTVCWWEPCQIRCIRHLSTVFSCIFTSTGLSARTQMQSFCVNRRMCVSSCAHECVFTKCLLNYLFGLIQLWHTCSVLDGRTYVRNAHVSHENLRAQRARRPHTGWVLPISGERHVCAPLITCASPTICFANMFVH